jgi:hypothetical protein
MAAAAADDDDDESSSRLLSSLIHRIPFCTRSTITHTVLISRRQDPPPVATCRRQRLAAAGAASAPHTHIASVFLPPLLRFPPSQHSGRDEAAAANELLIWPRRHLRGLEASLWPIAGPFKAEAARPFCLGPKANPAMEAEADVQIPPCFNLLQIFFIIFRINLS